MGSDGVNLDDALYIHTPMMHICIHISACRQGSDEEKRDVLEAYKKHKGKMGAVVNSIMLGTTADEDRFRTVIDAAIESKEVSSFPAFRKAARTGAGSKKSSAKRKAKVDKVIKYH